MVLIKLQLGKKGLTPGFIETLKSNFKNTENIRVSLLPSSTRDRKEVGQLAEKILAELGENYTCNIIGYTLVLRKWRKARIK